MTGEEPYAVYAHEQTDRSDPRFHEVEDMIEFQLEFPSGVIGPCMSMYSANQSHILLMGERGRLELEPATGYSGNSLRVGRGRTNVINPPAGTGNTRRGGAIEAPPTRKARDRHP